MASVFKRGGKGNRHGYWYVAWHEYHGSRLRRRTKCTLTTDKRRSASPVSTKQTQRYAEGVIDPTLEAIVKESQRTIESHLVDYERE